MLSSDTLQPRAIKPTKYIFPKQIKLDYKITKEKMAMEAHSSNELLFNFIAHNNDTISSTPLYNNNNNNTCNLDSSSNFLFESSNAQNPQEHLGATTPQIIVNEAKERRPSCAVQGRKKRRRRPKVCKNKEEAETQRMTHITMERNRRKQMNDHLAVLRSLMPESYVQRGDQASIVGGAIDFVKELEHLMQFLEAQKFQQLQDSGRLPSMKNQCTTPTADGTITTELVPNPFTQFFTYPQYCCSNMSNKFTCRKSDGAVADIEVTLIETHANIRILSRRRLRQLSRMVAGFQTIFLNILHLNVTTLDPLVLYSISAKVEEGCVLNSADEIAGAVHLMLKIIEEEALAFPYEDHHHN